MKDAISGRDKLDFRNLDLGSTCARVFLRSSVVYLQVYCRRPAWDGDADYQSRNYCSNSQKMVIPSQHSHCKLSSGWGTWSSAWPPTSPRLSPCTASNLSSPPPIWAPEVQEISQQSNKDKKTWGDHKAGAWIFPTETLGDALAQSCVVALID